MTPQDRGQIDLGTCALHQTNENKPPAMRERFKILSQIGCADTIEDDVGAASVGCVLDCGLKRPRVVIDRDVGAELETLLALGVAARGHDRAQSRLLAQQDRGRSDAAAAAVYQ